MDKIFSNTVSRFGFLFVTISFITACGFFQKNNWDMIGYMAAAISLEEKSSEKIHEKTYDTLKKELNEDNFSRLTDKDDNYRNEMLNNSSAFYENVNYYKFRVLYISIIYGFWKLGVSLTTACFLPSLISIGLLVFLLFTFLNSKVGFKFSALFSLLILFIPSTIDLATEATPDALSAMLLLLFSIIFINKKPSFILLIIAALLILTRTDNIIWIVIFSGLNIFNHRNKKTRIYYGIGIICSMLLFGILTFLYNHPGWWSVFYHTHIEYIIYPISNPPDFNVKEYFEVLLNPYSLIKTIPALILISSYFIYNRFFNFRINQLSKYDLLIITCIFTYIIRYVLFPANYIRFNLIFFILVVTMLLVKNKERIKQL